MLSTTDPRACEYLQWLLNAKMLIQVRRRLDFPSGSTNSSVISLSQTFTICPGQVCDD